MTRHRIHTDDGAELHFEEDGAGPPLMLVNGAFCTVRQWDRVVAVLARSFRVIRHDVRGTGRSGAGPDDHNCFEQYADDIVAIEDQLGVDQSVLWGMAWGATRTSSPAGALSRASPLRASRCCPTRGTARCCSGRIW
jgi:pimeloyl-ACP methyl ester carboxylesterase